ncbi:uncharacterized protein SPSC_06083 [Sporisorium scitamineum]|uniref:Uncharacterized protein n=1 Tax=Sporisorium scitamineum TaxID=49012 RepID=A0A127ZIZ1_9BASI|nr:uncharacterized protein SPSC_06083 [Sporisorium scitamineum]
MTAIQCQLTTLAFAFALLFALFLVEPVQADVDEDMILRARLELGQAHFDGGKKYSKLGHTNPNGIPYFHEHALAHAGTKGAVYVGSDSSQSSKTVRGLERLRLPSFGKRVHYLYSIIDADSVVGTVAGLIEENSNTRMIGVVHWKHTNGVEDLQVLMLDRIKDVNFDWGKLLRPFDDVLSVGK